MYVSIDLYGPLNRMSIQDSNGLIKNSVQTENKIFPSGKGWKYCFFEWDYLKQNQESLLPGGNLTICLEGIKPGPESAVSCLLKDLEESMNDLEFADCEIQTSEGTIKCHRMKLASRSSVFKERDFSFVTFENQIHNEIFKAIW